jgi:microcystin-dependent protein
MNGKRGRQVLAMKYIIRRIVALLVIAGIIAVPAVLGAYSYERDKGDNHNQVDSESNTLSYAQVEPHVRTYIDEEKIRITSDGEITSDEVAEVDEPADKDSTDNDSTDKEPAVDDPADEAQGADVPVYDTPSSVPDVAVGTVLIYAGDKVPDGFLLCDGREIPRGRYPSLYKVIGEKYGKGDGVTTFNLPDMDTLANNGIVGTVAAGNTANTVSVTEPAGTIPAGSAYIPIAGRSPSATAANVIPAEFAFEQTGAEPAYPAYKVSEPTGPPPVVDPDKFKQNDIEERPDSNPTANGATPTMYFIIKY